MKTKFIGMTAKVNMMQRLEKGDSEAINMLFEEIGRLEMIVGEYESVMTTLSKTLNDTVGKTPKVPSSW